MDHDQVPILRRVPPEIWCKIFITLHDIFTHEEKGLAVPLRRMQDNMQAICSVCREWRELAVTTSHLWQQIFFHGRLLATGPTGSLEFFKAALVRSGTQSIEMVLIMLEGNFIAQTEARSLCLENVLYLVLPHIHRVKRLLTYPRDPPEDMPQRLFLTNPMYVLDRTVPWSGIPLTKLEWLGFSDVTLPLSVLRFLLRYSQGLVNLNLRRMTIDEPNAQLAALQDNRQPFSFPSLHAAQWDIVLFHQMSQFGMDISNLVNLRLHMTWPITDGRSLMVDIFGAAKALRRLTFEGPFSDRQVMDILLVVHQAEDDNTPADEIDLSIPLHVLELHGCEAGSLLLDILSQAHVSSRFRALTSLEILCGTAGDGDVLKLVDAFAPPDAEDNTSSAPTRVQLRVEGCHSTSAELGEILKEQQAGVWLETCDRQGDFACFTDFPDAVPSTMYWM